MEEIEIKGFNTLVMYFSKESESSPFQLCIVSNDQIETLTKVLTHEQAIEVADFIYKKLKIK